MNEITRGPISKNILKYFFPILLGTFFQQLYNTTDAIIVGRFLGKEALSAVGGGTGTVVTLLIGFFTGLTSGSTVLISQFYGAKQDRKVHDVVHTSIALAFIGGLIITILGIIGSPLLLKLLKTPTEILDLSIEYITLYFAGVIPGVLYTMGSGILQAIGDSKRPFIILLIGSILNIVTDLLFIAVFNLGVKGAAYATIISQISTVVLVFICLMKTTDSYKLTIKDIHIDFRLLYQILRIGLPTGIQSILYTISNLVIQLNINNFGTNTIAAWAAFGKIDSLYWMSINSFGIAVMTFTGQNYGAKQLDRVHKGIKKSLFMALIGTIFLSFIFYFFGTKFFSLFTTDEEVLAEGKKIIQFIAPTFFTYVSIEVLTGAIRGFGKALIPMLITSIGVCLFRILWLRFAIPLYPEVTTVCAAYPISWIITSIMLWFYYLKRFA